MGDEEVICSFEEMLGRADIDAWVDACAYDARMLVHKLTVEDSTMPPPLTRHEAVAYAVARVHGAQRDYCGEAEAEDAEA